MRSGSEGREKRMVKGMEVEARGERHYEKMAEENISIVLIMERTNSSCFLFLKHIATFVKMKIIKEKSDKTHKIGYCKK